MGPVRVLVVDDHEFVRRGICTVLTADPNLTICAQAVDGIDAVEKAETTHPDVVVMDISMPRMNGLEATREIKRLLPATEVVVVSQHAAAEMFRQAVSAGARAYVVKSSIATDLLEAIARVSRHETYVAGVEQDGANPNLDAQEILQRSAAFERALRESEERFRSAMNNMAEGLYTLDTEGLVTYINPAAEAMFGWSFAELLGKKMHNVTHYEHPDGTPFPAADCPGLQVLQKGLVLREHEDTFIRKDGSHFPVVFSASPLRMHGAVLGVVVSFRDDTQRREAEAAMRREVAAMNTLHNLSTRLGSDLELRELLEISLDAAIALTGAQRGNVQLLDADTGVLCIFVHRGFEAPFLEFFHEVRGEHFSACAAALASGNRVVVEDVVTSPVFENTPAQQVMIEAKVRAVQSSPLLARSGRLLGMLSTHFESPRRLSAKDGQLLDMLARQTADLIERREAEEALRRTTAHFRLATDTMAVAVTRCSRDLRYLWMNPRYAEWIGQPADEIIGHSIAEILGEDAFQRLLPRFEQVLRGESISFDEQIPFKGIGPLWISAAYEPTFDSQGVPDGWVASIVDVTGRKEAERALRDSEGRFRAIVETTPECVKLVSEDGTLLHMNPPGLAMIGVTCAAMVIGKNVYDLIAPHDRERYRAFNEKICRGEKGSLEFDIVTLDGRGRHLETHAAPLRMNDGSLVHLAVTRDVTEQIRIQEQLRGSEERLRILAEELEKQVLARTVELEQRNAEVLRQSEQLRELSNRLLQTQNEERRHIARELHDSAGQLMASLSMNLARIMPHPSCDPTLSMIVDDSQKLVQQLSTEIRTAAYLLHPPLLDETGLPGAIRWYTRGLAERGNLRIDLVISEDFGRLPRDMELAVFRIVQECLTNVHRHSGSTTATVRMSRGFENVALEIQDEGKGIPLEKLDAIHGQRSGVGIMGMRERVRSLKGTMDIHSNGKGTKISVTLPISRASVSPAEGALQKQVSGFA